jgi:predicted transposase YbfD/YdcC
MDAGATCTTMTHFEALDDPRVERAKRHDLLDIVTIALCTVICGADGWVEIEEFGTAKQTWLATFLVLPNGIPSHDTFGRVFAALDGAQFAACVRGWVAAIAERTAGQVIAVDGKALRRSHDRGVGKGPLHLVSAWVCTNRLVLAQLPVTEKSNEITALPALLRMLALEGCIVTIDAMGCQTEVAQTIRDEDGAYVLALKKNQGRLHRDVEALFTEALAAPETGLVHDTHRAVDGDHGRIEIRQAWVITDAATLRYLDLDGRWADLSSVGMVQAERRVGTEVSRETRYYLSSLAPSARTLNDAVRSHWGIENTVHWVLDLAFREDESRVRTGESAHNLAVLRHIALNLLRKEKTARCGIKARRLKAGWDHQYLLKVLAA